MLVSVWTVRVHQRTAQTVMQMVHTPTITWQGELEIAAVHALSTFMLTHPSLQLHVFHAYRPAQPALPKLLAFLAWMDTFTT